MNLLILGLVIFLGVHSVRVFAAPWRDATRARLGEGAWKGAYSVLSLVGFVAICWGYALARQAPVTLWMPPVGMRHAASLLTLGSFVLLAAAYVPRNVFKARWGHPMLLGTKLWALAHLLANGNLADVLLFGGFLAWAVLLLIVSRRNDRAQGTTYPAASRTGTAVTVLVGGAAWVVFALWAHGLLIGVRPFG
ncbi:MAG: NnrU family protein [Hydrogenophaga sp.]|nr:NnrU family protein [Hydrogenophaga sp.]